MRTNKKQRRPAARSGLSLTFLALLLSGCSTVGDVFRVDRLLDHANAGAGQEQCIVQIKAENGSIEKHRVPDCNPLNPPLNLATFILPGRSAGKSSFQEVLECEALLATKVSLPVASVPGLRALLDAVDANRKAAKSHWQAMMPSHPPSLALLDAGLSDIEKFVGSARQEIDVAQAAAAAGSVVELALSPAVLSGAADAAHTMAGGLDQELAKARAAAEGKPEAADAKTRLADLEKGQRLVMQMTHALDKSLRILPTESQYCMRLRNDLQSALITRSDAICEQHKGQIHATATGTNLGLGLATTVLAGVGALTTGGGAQVAAAGAAITNTARSQFSELVYQQQYVGVITRAIDMTRQRHKAAIDVKRKTGSVDYGVAEAVRDAQDYHFRCSFYAGMQEMADALGERQARSPAVINARLAELEDEIKKLESAGADKSLSVTYRSLLSSERFRLLLSR